MDKRLLLLAIMLCAAIEAFADSTSESKTVIVKTAQDQREKKIGHANLCAGYLLLGQAKTALGHCNWVLDLDPYHWRTYNNRALVYLRLGRLEESEADIKRGQELNPRSETLKEVKGIYLDEVAPVEEKIIIDDRRNEPLTPVDTPE
jgi:Flp pilus assembly protein TadD